MHLSKLVELCPLEGKHIVDVGCGEGTFAAAMAKYKATVTGIEINSDKVSHARRMHGNAAAFLVGKADNILVESRSTDLITFMFSMHHVPGQEQALAIEECIRCLKPGGRLHVVEPDIVGPMTMVVNHVDDETEIRKNTQAFLNALDSKTPFTLLTKAEYDLKRTYRDFEEIVKSVVLVDAGRAAKLETVRKEMEQSFLDQAIKTSDGYELSQPCIMHHFELAQ